MPGEPTARVLGFIGDQAGHLFCSRWRPSNHTGRLGRLSSLYEVPRVEQVSLWGCAGSEMQPNKWSVPRADDAQGTAVPSTRLFTIPLRKLS